MKDSFGAQRGKRPFLELVESENKGGRFLPFSLLFIINYLKIQVEEEVLYLHELND